IPDDPPCTHSVVGLAGQVRPRREWTTRYRRKVSCRQSDLRPRDDGHPRFSPVPVHLPDLQQPGRHLVAPTPGSTAPTTCNGSGCGPVVVGAAQLRELADTYAHSTLCEVLGDGVPILALPMVNNRLWVTPPGRGTSGCSPRPGSIHDGTIGEPRPVQSDT